MKIPNLPLRLLLVGRNHWKLGKIKYGRFNSGHPGPAGCGGLICDYHGNWLTAFARAVGITSSLVAELWAIRDGLTRCCALSLEVVLVEVDASVVIPLVSQANHANGEFSSLIDDCRNLWASIP
nr:hypothetical protein CFP56_40924 [Quercus suber]